MICTFSSPNHRSPSIFQEAPRCATFPSVGAAVASFAFEERAGPATSEEEEIDNAQLTAKIESIASGTTF
jgi:hypothetical protein